MKQGLTEIAIVLDRSGSMADCRESTIAGFNEFVEGQKAVPGEAFLTLAQFDSVDPFELVFSHRSLSSMPKLTYETYAPRGGTPLHDAIGRMIVDLGAKLRNLSESQRPAQVIVVIMTDGYENASQEFDAPKIAKMIEHQRSAYNWQFIFLGANQDAILTGESLNIPRSMSMSYLSTPFAVVGTFTATSNAVTRSRMTGQSVQYSQQDRKIAMEGEENKCESKTSNS